MRTLVALVPLPAAAVVGGGLRVPSTSWTVRRYGPGGPVGLAHLLGPTALAGALPALTVLDEGLALGPAPVLRNLLEAAGTCWAAPASRTPRPSCWAPP